MAAKINKNRYRLITLLYLVFVCLSVLNVPTSLFQSNLYVIKSYQHQENLILNEIKLNNNILDSLGVDSIKNQYYRFYKISNKVYFVLDSVDNQIKIKLLNDSTNIDNDFNSRRKIESYFQKDGLLERTREVVFNYRNEIIKNSSNSDTSIFDLVPIKSKIIGHSGKEVEWDQYLFLHKPLGISYMQLKRIKVLFLQEMLSNQKMLIQYKLQSQYNYTNSITKLPLNNLAKVADPITYINSEMLNNQSIQNMINKNNNFNDSIIDNQKQLEAILSSLKIDKLYAGVQNIILTEFSSTLFENINVTFSDKSEVIKNKDNYKVSFSKPGIYKIRFSNNLSQNNDIIFEKSIKVYPLPDPIVALNVKNLQSGIISKRMLINSTRLIVTISNADFENFPGRINGFRCVKYNINNLQETVYNYSENFQSSIMQLLSNAQKGDIVVFDNITISLNDGSSRTAIPLIYKISE